MRMICLILLTAMSAPALATNMVVTTDELDPTTFPETAAEIRDNLDNPSLVRLTSTQKSDVLRTLDRLEQALGEGVPPSSSRVQGLQARINRILAPSVAPKQQTADVICERILPVGSRIPKTECRDRNERDREQYVAQEFYRRATQEKKMANQ